MDEATQTDSHLNRQWNRPEILRLNTQLIIPRRQLNIKMAVPVRSGLRNYGSAVRRCETYIRY